MRKVMGRIGAVAGIGVGALILVGGPAMAAQSTSITIPFPNSVTAHQCVSGGGTVLGHSVGGSICLGGTFSGKGITLDLSHS